MTTQAKMQVSLLKLVVRMILVKRPKTRCSRSLIDLFTLFIKIVQNVSCVVLTIHLHAEASLEVGPRYIEHIWESTVSLLVYIIIV